MQAGRGWPAVTALRWPEAVEPGSPRGARSRTPLTLARNGLGGLQELPDEELGGVHLIVLPHNGRRRHFFLRLGNRQATTAATHATVLCHLWQGVPGGPIIRNHPRPFVYYNHLVTDADDRYIRWAKAGAQPRATRAGTPAEYRGEAASSAEARGRFWRWAKPLVGLLGKEGDLPPVARPRPPSELPGGPLQALSQGRRRRLAGQASL